ncbi:hypothetical protein EVAR_18210_1 [Eumeta japonica]|uniref:Uncharacterized protein n=1 Tax=Eumeta variegata TaxID=151549 RepID=A0A4C1UV95_EUMVA|nr:hypothetical protein EVAR_18210_1 [Eumeta japonica]
MKKLYSRWIPRKLTRSKNGPRHLVQCHAYQIQNRGYVFGLRYDDDDDMDLLLRPQSKVVIDQPNESIEMTRNQAKWRASDSKSYTASAIMPCLSILKKVHGIELLSHQVASYYLCCIDEKRRANLEYRAHSSQGESAFGMGGNSNDLDVVQDTIVYSVAETYFTEVTKISHQVPERAASTSSGQ